MKLMNREKIIFRVKRHADSPKYNKIHSRWLRYISKFFGVLKWYLLHQVYFIEPGLYYSNIEFAVTTNCTLRCKHCAHYIYRYKGAPYTSPEVLIADLEKLLGAVRWVDEFRLLGGEPLLYPGLSRLAAYLLSSDKIGKVEIITNGTLAPKKELLDLFPNERLNIYVSNYGELSRKLSAFTSVPDINVTIPPQDLSWLDHGNLSFQGRSEKELTGQYSRCSRERCLLLDGKLFNCATSAFGSDLKAFALKPEEFVDLRKSEDRRELKKKLKKLRRRRYFTACNYCNWGTDQLVPIGVAEQAEK